MQPSLSESSGLVHLQIRVQSELPEETNLVRVKKNPVTMHLESECPGPQGHRPARVTAAQTHLIPEPVQRLPDKHAGSMREAVDPEELDWGNVVRFFSTFLRFLRCSMVPSCPPQTCF